MQLRIGSRGSQLALWQASHIADKLRQQGHQIAIRIIHTTGDKIASSSLAPAGTKGIFTKEIEEALEAGEIDMAVHSLKDLPTEIAGQFEIAAVLAREDPRDALCSKRYSSLLELPQAATVGTSSLRRQAQLKALRPDLTVRPLRGNVDTRLGKLETGEYDAIVLAAAGLTRLGRNGLLRQSFPVEAMCPAAGQGALAVEIRYGDVPVREAVSSLDDPSSRLETDCERALLRGLGGGCQVPIGANARLQNEALELRGVIVKPDGSELLWETGVGQDALLLGRRIAENLLRRGGAGILQLVYGQAVGLPGQP